MSHFFNLHCSAVQVRRAPNCPPRWAKKQQWNMRLLAAVVVAAAAAAAAVAVARRAC